MAGAAASRTVTARLAVVLQSVLGAAVGGVAILVVVAKIPLLIRLDRLTATPTNRAASLDDRLALLSEPLVTGPVASGVSRSLRRHPGLPQDGLSPQL